MHRFAYRAGLQLLLTLFVSAASAQTSKVVQVADVPATGRVINVTVGVKGVGRFEPSEVHASPGDVIEFVATFGVHNIDFPAATNPGKKNLPPPSEYLLRRGDTYRLKVDLAPGTYNFQCDPHSGMGMKGTLIVTAANPEKAAAD